MSEPELILLRFLIFVHYIWLGLFCLIARQFSTGSSEDIKNEIEVQCYKMFGYFGFADFHSSASQ